MSSMTNFLGTWLAKWRLKTNSSAGVVLKEDSTNEGVLSIMNDAETDFAVARAAGIPATGATMDDIANLFAVNGSFPTIEYSFDGASPPSPATYTGQWGFVHTAGGAYSAGDVVYSDGTSLYTVPVSVCKALSTKVAVSGTVSLIQYGMYTRTAAGVWGLVGDGTAAGTGTVRHMSIPYDYADSTVDSTATIPAGGSVLEVRNIVDTVFNGTAPTVAVTVNGSVTQPSILSTTESDVTETGETLNLATVDIDSDSAGAVRVTVTPDGSTTGAGTIRVSYIEAAQA